MTNNNDLKKQLLSVETGDVVRFKGWLADYKNIHSGLQRKTSTVRTDTGNGACEVVFINDFEILKKANPFWRTLYQISKASLFLSAIGFLIFFIQTPFRNRL